MPYISGAKCDFCSTTSIIEHIVRKKDIESSLRKDGWSFGRFVRCPKHNPRSEQGKMLRFERMINEVNCMKGSKIRHEKRVLTLQEKILDSNLKKENRDTLWRKLLDQSREWEEKASFGNNKI